MRFVFLISLFFYSFHSTAQQSIGLQGGWAICTNNHASTTKTTAFSLTYEESLSSRYIIGGMAAYSKYSFDEGYSNDDYRRGAIYINHNCDYLFVAPTLGIAVGKRRHLHFYLVPAFGVPTTISESVKEGFDLPGIEISPGRFGPSTHFDTVYNNNSKVNKAVFRLGLAMQKQVVLSKYLMLTISASYNYMFSKIAEVHHVYDKETSDPNVKGNLLSLQFGVSYQLNKKSKTKEETP